MITTSRMLSGIGLVILCLTIPAAHADPVARVPVLRITAPNGSTSILVGTIHVPVDGLPQPASTLMSGARQYVIESSVTAGPQPAQQNLMDMVNPAARSVLAASVIPSPEKPVFHFPSLPMAPWATGLSAGQLSLFRERLRCNLGNTPVNVEQIAQLFLAYNSPEAAFSVAQRPCSKPGLLSRDELIARAAAARGLQPVVLESQVEVDEKRKAVPDKVYQDGVYRMLSSAGQRDTADAARAIARGDYDRVLEINARSSDPGERAAFEQLMVKDRNEAWRPELHDVLDKGDAVIVIGASHLGGPEGIIALLKADGFKVEPTTVAAGPASSQ